VKNLSGKKLHPVGFEPTSTNTFELESNPLDRSGTDARTILLHEVSILGPLGYEPNTLPLRHGADIKTLRKNIYVLLYLQVPIHQIRWFIIILPCVV
jgi:hypothetical protein